MKALPGPALRRRLLVCAAFLSVAGCAFIADPVAALPDPTSDGAVTISVEIAPRPSSTDAGGMPTTGLALLPPAAVATAAVLGGALLLLGRRRERRE